MVSLLQKIVAKIELAPLSFSLWLGSFLAIIIARILVENWLGHFANRTGLYLFYEFSHTFLFFLIAYLLFLWLLHKFLKVNFRSVANFLLLGYLIIVTPPIIDYIISRGQGFWSFYKFDSLGGLIHRFFTFFGDKPEIGITYGVRVEVALVVIFIFIYSLIKLNHKTQITNNKQYQNYNLKNSKIGNLQTKNRVSAILFSGIIAIISYIILFTLGTFPAWITIIIEGFSKGFLKVTGVDVAQMFITPASLFSRNIPDIISSLNIKMSLVYALVLSVILLLGLYNYQKEKFISFLKNIRPPQLVVHGGILVIGMVLGTINSARLWSIDFFNVLSFLLLGEAVFLAWLASVVVNDIADYKIDEKTNSARPLIQKTFTLWEYKNLSWVLFYLSIFLSAIVNFKIALLLLVYQAIAFIYSSWPLRLKRFPFVSTFLSAVALLIILFSGYILVSPSQDISSLSFSIILLLTIGYTLSLPIKDFKDLESDRENGVYTIPAFFGEEWGKIIVGGGIFISFILSVILLNEFRLFWWALIFGSLSFWMVSRMSAKGGSAYGGKKDPSRSLINYRSIFWWMLGIVTIYGIILVKVIFL